MARGKDDKRVRRTKRAIREALLRLIQDKPVARVTTTELCAEADINRNTFYAHYSAPEEVLAEVEEEFLNEISSMLEETYEDGEFTLSMFKAIDASRERWRAIWHGDPDLLGRAVDICCERALAHWDSEGMPNKGEGALFLRFITRGASGVVGDWLDEGCRTSPEQMSALVERFVFDGRRAIVPEGK